MATIRDNRRRVVRMDDTRFIFQTNFEGNPDNDPRYHSTSRQGNVVIPDPELAEELLNSGFNVKQTRPRPGYEEEFEPEYYIAVKLNFNPPSGITPPVVKLITRPGTEPIQLDADTVRRIDILQNQRMIQNVSVMCNARYNDDGRNTLWVKYMYVEQRDDMDPYADRYQAPTVTDTDDDLPF